MDPLVRQTSLQILLLHHHELGPEQLHEALHLGLNDPDLEINQLAWNFIKKHQLISNYKKDLTRYAKRLQAAEDNYSKKLAGEVLGEIEKG